MPIKINTNADAIITNMKSSSKSLYTPKYFSKEITGSGKATGLLSQAINPANLLASVPENSVTTPHWHIHTDINKYVKITSYPLNPLGSYTPVGIKGAVTFDATWCHITSPTGHDDYYVMLTPMSLSITEPITTAAANLNTTNNVSTGKKCAILYRIAIVKVETNANNEKICTIEDVLDFTENPLATFNNSSLSQTNKTEFRNYIQSYDAYFEICRHSETWQTNIINIILDTYDKDPLNFPIGKIIRYISQYRVTLSQYNTFYTGLKQRFNPDELKDFTKMNTSLLLQETLDSLATANFPVLPPPMSTNKHLDLSWCSKEQFDAITSATPLNLVQAGAGTGKSTVIKSRIDYLDYLGIDLNKVMVLSFTNAAADNIKARCPGIQSMTIAKMIDTIYTENHPNHQLSSSFARKGEGSTFTNSLDVYKDTMPHVRDLINAVDRAEHKNDYATLLRLVEENYADIIKILDTVQQTTFHLEIIICYLEHATMKIPFQIDHLLIDEVQDNAIFEFIFFLNLTCKLHNHLYLVGDCSQTLYEFRASDPKALNAIESSGLFATFPLNINYRSNQDVLTFANALLNDIEANQYANIQLQSFKLGTTTKQSFMDHVTVDYNRLDKISEMEEFVVRKLHAPKVLNWINDKLMHNEQICVLAYKRREAMIFMKELEKLYPNRKLISIIPTKNISFAYISNYVSTCRQQLMALPASNAKDIAIRIRAEIIANLSHCRITPSMPAYAKIIANIQTMLVEWETKNTDMLNDTIGKFNAGLITHEKFVEIIADSLINFEIHKNAVKQTLMSQANATKKEDTDNADFIFSTIHSAKGLEFDNVILLYQNKNQMEEDAKRMYYVALTRAKKAEYVIAYDTVLNSIIQSRYDTVIQHLPDANTAIPLACGT